MIKQIPRHLFSEEMSSNVTHFNLKNLLNNYEAIFNVENFKVSTYYKNIFEQILIQHKEVFKNLLEQEIESDELKSETYKQFFERDFSETVYNSSYKEILKNVKDDAIYTKLISLYTNSEPLIGYKSSQKNENSGYEYNYTLTGSNYETFDSKDYKKFLITAFPDFTTLDYNTIDWFYNVIWQKTFKKTLCFT